MGGVRTLAEVKHVIAEGMPDLLVTGLEAPEGDVLDFRPGRRRCVTVWS